MNIVIGSDPEYMVHNEDQNRIISALDILPNGKVEKIDLGDGVEIYADNANAECALKPASSEDELVANFTDLVRKTAEFLANFRSRLKVQAAHTFDDGDLLHPASRIAGCGEAYDANTITVQQPPDLSETNLRVAGGHIHMSRDDWKKAKNNSFLRDPMSRVAACRAVERYLSPALVLINQDPTNEIRTQNAYSQPGAHRTPPWGLEYRVPSNFWTSDPRYVRLVHRITAFALKKCEEDVNYWLDKDCDLKTVSNIILSGNKKDALAFIKKNHPKEIAKEAIALSKLPYSPFLDTNYGVA